MQIRRYPSCLKISLSIDALIKAIHPTYSDEQRDTIRPYILNVLRKCKRFPFKVANIFIVADRINSWYTLYGQAKHVLEFIKHLVAQEIDRFEVVTRFYSPDMFKPQNITIQPQFAPDTYSPKKLDNWLSM